MGTRKKKDEVPNLILDFELKDESIYIRFANESNFEAHNIKVEFSETIFGLNGTKKISSLNLFRELTYMAPHKEFMIYVDEFETFFNLLNNTTFNIRIKFYNSAGKKIIKKIVHNLLVYKDLHIILKNK